MEKVGTLIMKDVYDHNLTLHFSNQSEINSEDIRIGGCHWNKCSYFSCSNGGMVEWLFLNRILNSDGQMDICSSRLAFMNEN